jgi:hypothetical protein
MWSSASYMHARFSCLLAMGDHWSSWGVSASRHELFPGYVLEGGALEELRASVSCS